jgi:hypothetical protein
MRAAHLAVVPLVVSLGLGACRGWERDTGPYESCDPGALEPGQVRARRMPCDDEAIAGGEGTRADWVIENAHARFVVRNPGTSLTLLGVAGGTIIDAAPPGGEDRLTELVPLVGGGWLEELELSSEQGAGEASITLSGVPAAISFLEHDPGLAARERVGVTYRLGADDLALSIEGADGFWLLPMAEAEQAGSTLRQGGLMLGVDGELVDRGGGLLGRGGSHLAAGEPSAVMAALWPGGPTISGQCDGEGVELLEGSRVVGWLPVDEEGRFAGTAPAGVDGLRALAAGHAPGAPVAAGRDVTVPLGPEGWLGVRVADRYGRELSALVEARDGHGGMRALPVAAGGGWLPLGAGSWEVEVDAGPLYSRTSLWFPFLEGRRELEVIVDGPGPPSGWALADLGVEAWPSRSHRVAPAHALARAAARGVGFAVISASDEVASAELEQPWERTTTGSGTQAQSDHQGSVLAWPVNANAKKAAHGAVAWSGLGAEDILRVAAGKQGQGRILAVDAAWLEAAGPSFGWDPAPDIVRLDSYDDVLVYLGLLERWVALSPAGPLTWAWLGHGEAFTAVEVEQAMIEGRTVASTGPLMELRVDGEGPGALVESRGPQRVQLRLLAPRDTPLAGAALVVDGVERQRWDLEGAVEQERLSWSGSLTSDRYVLALAWGPQDQPDGHWVVSAPVWTGSP